MTDRWSPRGLAAALERITGGSQLQSATVKGMICNTGSDVGVDASWDAAATMAAFSPLNEYSEASYARETVANLAIAVDTGVNSDEVYVTFDPIVWATLAAGANVPAYVVLYFEESGAAADPALTNRVPLARFDAVFTPDGSNYTFNPLAAGALRASTN